MALQLVAAPKLCCKTRLLDGRSVARSEMPSETGPQQVRSALGNILRRGIITNGKSSEPADAGVQWSAEYRSCSASRSATCASCTKSTKSAVD